MLGSLLCATALTKLGALGPQFPQRDPQDPQQKPAKAAPFTPPTPWFNKDEDTFDLPEDPKHRAQVVADAVEGHKEALEVLKEFKASTNMAYQERVERIGQQIAHIANHTHAIATFGDKRFSPYHYRYTVIQGDDINAFSLQGGYIFVYEGLMKFVESDDELAGILGHETAHAAFRHVPTEEEMINKSQWIAIPALIAGILTRSPGVIIGSQVASMAAQSGWSIDAEKAADYGGFQFLEKSNYNPVAMLTFMERLAMKYGFYDRILNNTIMQTHPVTKERAYAMMMDLKNAGIPIIRSKASAAFRVSLVTAKDGTVDAYFNKTKIYKFSGPEAHARAEAALPRLNDFYDAVPELFQVTANPNNQAICFKGYPVLKVDLADAVAQNLSEGKLMDSTLGAIKASLFNLNFIVFMPDGAE
jgi:Zn-dependent protease with chaperone function